ncbi:biotin--[acetyl-CoA-carboxylase] ligase [soil metagenome]
MTSPTADRGGWSDLERPPLDARALRRALQVGEPGSWWQRLDVVDSTGSTNADLAAAARSGAAGVVGATGAAVLVAEHQHAGRGRLDRSWRAPPRSALTLSVLVHPQVPAARWPWLPLLTGVAVAETVRRVAGLDAVLKWPNDVLVDDRKLAGVLLERVETPAGAAAVIGIGLNVTAGHAELPVPAATSLAFEGAASTDRQPILVHLLRTLQALHSAWVEGAEGLHASYLRRCSTVGRQVRVELPDGGAVVGLAETVDADGRLVVATATGRHTLAVGDVRHVHAAE